jgi:anti-sigma B factor antagonist
LLTATPSIETTRYRTHCVVTLEGDLDISSVGRTQVALAELTSYGATRVVVDCTKLRFLDSAMLATLLAARLTLHRRGGWLRLAGTGPTLRWLLEVTELAGELLVYPTVDAAVADLPEAG